jgi:carboxypeptidase C (cathepsin A)
MVSTRTLLSFLALASTAFAGIPPTPEGLTIVNSTVQSGAYISFKETKICETTPGVKSYAGYVHLPPNALEGQNYPIHTFFWFFEARSKPTTSPLSIWLQGGPGSPTVVAAVSENGPCSVSNDSESTVLNPWSWNNEVNMLYIDQPVQTGFSYDTLNNGTIDELFLPFFAALGEFKDGVVPEATLTKLPGTFFSQKFETGANTTAQTSRALWHFLQTWTSDFPEYKSDPNKDKDTFSLWGESYGGHYVPITADYISKQNDLIKSGQIAKPAKHLNVDTVGLVNACIDGSIQIPLYPEMAYNNTYGIKAYNETVYELALSKIDACQSLIKTCQTLADASDPQGLGNNAQANKACHLAYKTCFDTISVPYPATEVRPTPSQVRPTVSNPATPSATTSTSPLRTSLPSHPSGQPDTSTGPKSSKPSAFPSTSPA